VREPQPRGLAWGWASRWKELRDPGETPLSLAPLLALIFSAAGCKRGRSQGRLVGPTANVNAPTSLPVSSSSDFTAIGGMTD
jgi:hypothetical protein